MNTRLDPKIVAQVRSLLSQGYRIGTEHADLRRFKTSSWQSCAPIESSNDSQVLSALEGCLRDHAGEYVRLLGIDTQNRARVLETLIQRPDGSTPDLSGTVAIKSSNGRASSYATVDSNGGSTLADQVRALLSQGCQIALEYADQRRFKTSSWQSAGLVEATHFKQVMLSIESTLQEHEGAYVRLLGVDPLAKRRVVELVIQRADGKPVNLGNTLAGNVSTASASATATYGVAASTSSGLTGEILTQIRGLLSQGFRVAAEAADVRRFRTGSWQTCPPIESSNEHQVVAALAKLLSDYEGQYVRLLGIDPKARRRVLEVIVQRP
ncbi:MAG: ribulose bisphosphate carboxylase small subunit [Prochlorotrichaceae cyanobacterium]